MLDRSASWRSFSESHLGLEKNSRKTWQFGSFCNIRDPSPALLKRLATIVIIMVFWWLWLLPGITRDSLANTDPKMAFTKSDHLPPLRFRDDGTFQISIFQDLHFGESRLSSNYTQTPPTSTLTTTKPERLTSPFTTLTNNRRMGHMGPRSRQEINQRNHQHPHIRTHHRPRRPQRRPHHRRKHLSREQHVLHRPDRHPPLTSQPDLGLDVRQPRQRLQHLGPPPPRARALFLRVPHQQHGLPSRPARNRRRRLGRRDKLRPARLRRHLHHHHHQPPPPPTPQGP